MKNKTYGHKTFKLDDNTTVDCFTYEQYCERGHKAYLKINNKRLARRKIKYINRTWEAYTYQTILSCIVESVSNKIISKVDKERYQKKIQDDSFSQDRDAFKSIAIIAKMGELLTDTQKGANDWKARILKAGIGEALSMPEDWDTLTENEKQDRLDKAIQAIA